jgi:hypothetical protein
MRNLAKQWWKVRRRRNQYGGVDGHKWASKMEIHRMNSGKADLELKRDHKSRN